MTAAKNDLSTDTKTADLTSQIETLRAEVTGLTQTIADLAKETGEDVASAMQAKASNVRDTVVDQTETARLHAMELQDQATDFVRSKPATALGIAAGIGLLVGLLSARK